MGRTPDSRDRLELAGAWIPLSLATCLLLALSKAFGSAVPVKKDCLIKERKS